MKKFIAVAILMLSACTGSSKKKIWIYTSSYKEAVALYKTALEKEFPEVEIQWFQSGSENVASKVTAEMAGGAPQADILMTSDVFFYQEMKRRDALRPLDKTPAVDSLPATYLDPQRAFIVNRFPIMVIAYNTQKVAEADRPTGFEQLLQPKYKGKITMPSPLESGTALTAILFLKNMFGEGYFEGLRKNEVLASGGNGSVMARIQSGERPIGVILMENILQAKERGLKSVEFVIPSEGGLPMPSCLAVLKTTKEPVIAQKIVDWILQSARSQEILRQSYVYSSLASTAAPQGAPEWKTLKMKDWSLAEFDKWGSERQAVKEMFQKAVLR